MAMQTPQRPGKVRVLVVDDSALVRQVLSEILVARTRASRSSAPPPIR